MTCLKEDKIHTLISKLLTDIYNESKMTVDDKPKEPPIFRQLFTVLKLKGLNVLKYIVL